MKDVPVLIVGGGPVGLTASILLSRPASRSLLVERHPGTAIHPKARGINARTMEIFRQQRRRGRRPRGRPAARNARASSSGRKTLAGEEIERRVPWRAERAERRRSAPVRNCLCAQDDLEPVLRRCAEQQPLGDAALQHRAHGLRAGRRGVIATLVDTRDRRAASRCRRST